MILQLVKGIMSVLSVGSSPLYRYPYRNAAEAFRGDMNRIARDVNNALERLEQDKHSR